MVHVDGRPLKVFLCHASGDKPPVRDLYERLTAEGVDVWLDQEKLLPGQDWRMEIPRAVREADVVVICLSKKSITKEGYVQKEIKFALDIAEEKPEGTIFLIPARLEDCVVPERLNRWQWVDLYEDNGFIRILRSLKLRADAVGATIEPDLYVDSAKETDRRLEQLYTEGLAAFYTEDWDRACRCFQSILSERPNHKNASEKLEEAERQRNLSKLYEQATGAVRSEDWGTAIQILEELSNKSADYKDAAQLLRNAHKQKQLRDLYAEAKALHVGKQWEAVVKVFEQISSIDPNYPDADGLLPSAQKEVTELKRIAELNDQYSHALREMDAGNWYEARRLLETVHKSQTGFLETEKLLRKVENEIVQEEKKRKQNDQINTLYEQAHGLLRSKKWRNALDKMGEIRKLDEHFPDADGIAEKAQKELAREEQEADRQNKLAALYAEAVKLLKEGKYQEALDKWGKVRSIDPKYPDRQRVGMMAKKALAKQVKPIAAKSKIVIPKSLWVGLGGIGAVVILVFGIKMFGNSDNKASLVPTMVPTAINQLQNTSTPRSAAVVPISLPELPEYDNFDNDSFEGSYNQGLWQIAYDGGQIYQESGNLKFAVEQTGADWLYAGLIAKDYENYKISHPISFEVKMSLNTADSGGVFMQLESVNKNSRYAIYACGIERGEDLHVKCTTSENEGVFEDIFYSEYVLASWHTFRLNVDPDKNEIRFYLDDKLIGTFTSNYPDNFSNTLYSLYLQSYVYKIGESTALVDYVRIDAPATSGYVDPTMYDDFGNSAYDGSYNKSLWSIYSSFYKNVVSQSDEQLSIKVSGKSDLNLNKSGSYKINKPFFFEARLFLDPKTTDSGTHFYIEVNTPNGGSNCGIFRTGDYAQQITCWGEYYGKIAETKLGLDGVLPGWHILRFEIDPTTMIISYVIDGRYVAHFDPKEVIPDHFTEFKYSNFNFSIGLNNYGPSKAPVGYIDYVRMGAIEDDPTVYDNFDNVTYDGKFDTAKWTYWMHDTGGSIYQENDVLVLSQSSTEDHWQFIKGTSVDFYPSVPAYIESALRLDPTAKRGDVQLGLNSNYGAVVCGISGPGSIAYCWCQSGDNQLFDEGISVKVDTWHFFRVEVISSKAEFIFYIDGQNIGSCILPTPTGALDSTAIIDVGGFGSKSIKGYIDYIRIGPLE